MSDFTVLVENDTDIILEVKEDSNYFIDVQTPGIRGAGVPGEGLTGQILKKKSNSSYDTEWATYSSSDGSLIVNNSTASLDVIIDQTKLGAIQLLGSSDISGQYNQTIVCDGSVVIQGNTIIYGDLICDAVTGTAGASLTVYGRIIASSIDMSGSLYVSGDVHSSYMYLYDDPSITEITIKGSLTVTDQVLSTVTTADINIFGDFILNNFYHFSPEVNSRVPFIYIGNLYCFNSFSIHGNQSYAAGIYVAGDCQCTFFDCDGENGGSGAQITVGKNFSGNASLKGANATASFPAGDGGNITSYGSTFYSYSCNLSGGIGGTYSRGNPGGDLDLGFNIGSVHIESFYSTGGSSSVAASGNGGAVFVSGSAFFNLIDLSGGSCSSPDGNNNSGYGGSVTVGGSLQVGSILLNGGSRSGTASSGAPTSAGNSGNMTVGNEFKCMFLYANGGSSTFVPSGGGFSNGGTGGLILIKGNCLVDDTFESNGGSSSLGNGGTTPGLQVKGFSTFNIIRCNGGSGTITRGALGVLIFEKGASGFIVSVIDGTGAGTAPTALGGLYFNHHFSCSSVNITNRTGTRMGLYASSRPASFHVNSLPGRTQLTNAAGTASNSISTMISNSIFITSGTTWLRLQGAAF